MMNENSMDWAYSHGIPMAAWDEEEDVDDDESLKEDASDTIARLLSKIQSQAREIDGLRAKAETYESASARKPLAIVPANLPPATHATRETASSWERKFAALERAHKVSTDQVSELKRENNSLRTALSRRTSSTGNAVGVQDASKDSSAEERLARLETYVAELESALDPARHLVKELERERRTVAGLRADLACERKKNAGLAHEMNQMRLALVRNIERVAGDEGATSHELASMGLVALLSHSQTMLEKTLQANEAQMKRHEVAMKRTKDLLDRALERQEKNEFRSRRSRALDAWESSVLENAEILLQDDRFETWSSVLNEAAQNAWSSSLEEDDDVEDNNPPATFLCFRDLCHKLRDMQALESREMEAVQYANETMRRVSDELGIPFETRRPDARTTLEAVDLLAKLTAALLAIPDDE